MNEPTLVETLAGLAAANIVIIETMSKSGDARCSAAQLSLPPLQEIAARGQATTNRLRRAPSRRSARFSAAPEILPPPRTLC